MTQQMREAFKHGSEPNCTFHVANNFKCNSNGYKKKRRKKHASDDRTVQATRTIIEKHANCCAKLILKLSLPVTRQTTKELYLRAAVNQVKILETIKIPFQYRNDEVD